MANIDQRVVSMKFDNAQFQKGVSSTVKSLDDLKSKLNFQGAGKGLNEISNSAKNFSVAGISNGVDSLVAKFSALSVVGIAALANITNKAVDAGLQLTKSLTIGPIGDGFSDYNKKLTSVKTIMNATGESLEVVDGYFRELDIYADKTIYDLGDMTSAFAKFTNAGLDMDKSVPAIKGIANMVAVAGQGADAASIAMYNLSQSLSGGFLTTTDYKSLNLANVATKEWKDYMIQAAVAAGTLKKSSNGMYTIPGAKGAFTDAQLFSEALSEGWANADVLVSVLGDYGDVTTEIGRKAQDAAQQVKSLPMMMDTLKAAVGTQWTDTFELLLGNVDESTELFTGMSEALSKVISSSGDARNKLLADWKALGGRESLIQAGTNAWQALTNVVVPIRDAFRDVFPPKTGKDLVNITDALSRFTQSLIAGEGTMKNVKRTFTGIFSVFKIALSIVSGLAKVLFGLFSVAGEGTGGFFALTAIVGDFLTMIQKLLTKTGAVDKFFLAILSPLIVLKPLVGFITDVAMALSALFSGDVSGFKKQFSGAVNTMKKEFSELGNTIGAFFNRIQEGLNDIIDRLKNFAKTAKTEGNAFVGVLASAAAAVLTFFATILKIADGKTGPFVDKVKSMGEAIEEFFDGFGGDISKKFVQLADDASEAWDRLRGKADFSPQLAAMRSGADKAGDSVSKLSVVASKLRDMWDAVSESFGGFGRGLGKILSAVGDFLTTLVKKVTNYISTLTAQDATALLNAGFLFGIYIAVKKLLGMFDEIGSLVKGVVEKFDSVGDSFLGIFDGITGTLESMQQRIKAEIIQKIAIAVALLVGALYILTKIDPQALAVALGGLTALFVQLAIALKVVSGTELSDEGSVTKAASAMILMAIALNIMAGAVKKLAGLSPAELGKGLGAVATLLTGLTLFTKFSSADSAGITAGLGLILLAVAIRILVSTVETLGLMDTGTLAKGIATLTVLMGLMAGITLIFSGTSGVLAAAAAMLILAFALNALIAAILIYANIDILTLAQGIGAIGVALAVIGGAMRAFPKKGMLASAAALAVVAGALVVISGVLKVLGTMDTGDLVRSILGLGAALLVIAIGMKALQGGAAGSLVLLAFAGALTVLLPPLTALGLLPYEVLFKSILGLVLVFTVLGLAALVLAPIIPIIVLLGASIALLGIGLWAAGGGMLLFTTALVALATLGTAGFAVIAAGFMTFLSLLPVFAQQLGLSVLAFSKVFRDVAPQVLEDLEVVIIDFLDMIDRLIPRFVDTGVKFILEFLRGMVRVVPKAYEALYKMAIGLLKVVRDNIGPFVTAGTDVILNFMQGMRDNLPRLIQGGIDLIVDFIRQFTLALKLNRGKINDAAAELALEIVKGLVSGIANGHKVVGEAALGLASSALEKAKSFLKINSPSKKFIEVGESIGEGFVDGIASGERDVSRATQSLANVMSIALDTSGNAIARNEERLNGLTDAQYQNAQAVKSIVSAMSKAGDAGGAELLAQLSELTRESLSNTEEITNTSTALDILKKTLSDTAQSAESGFDIRPVITPIIDLSEFKKSADTMSGMLADRPLAVAGAYSQAASTSAEYLSNKALIESAKDDVAPSVNFVQNNTSPKALSSAEIYRQTKNQLSVAAKRG